MEELADTPQGQLLAMFDALEEWFLEDGFKGCMFIKASAEFQNPDDAINAQAYAHKRMLVDHFENLATHAGAENPHALARQFLLLKEGAIVIAAMSHSESAAREAKSVASLLVASGLVGTQRTA
tara:strand:- start:226 stop:597 length:372 start_codon:yes stop_codon:yes gene_type:complete